MTKKLTALFVTVSLLAMCFAVSVSAQESNGYLINTTGFKYVMIQPGGIDGNYVVALVDDINQRFNWGTVDKNGKVVIPVEKRIDEVMSDESFGFKTDYEIKIESNMSSDDAFIYSLTDKDGKVIIPPGQYKTIIGNYGGTDFKELFVVVDKNNKYGIFDAKTKKLVVPCIYTKIAPGFKEGLTSAEYNGKLGFIDKNNNVVIDFKYDSEIYPGLCQFANGQVIVSINGVYKVITKKGEELASVEGQDIVLFVDKEHKYLAIGKQTSENSGIIKIIDYSGKVIIDNASGTSFFMPYCASEFGILSIEKDSKYYLYNSKLEKIDDTAYDKIDYGFEDDVFMCTKKVDGKTYYDFVIEGKKVISNYQTDEIGDNYQLIDKNNIIVTDKNLMHALFKIAYPNPNYSYNDISGDKKVSTVDALLILRYKAGVYQLDETKQALGDVDNNKKLTTVDALLILKYVAGIYD